MNKPSLFRPLPNLAEAYLHRGNPLAAAQRVDAQDAVTQITDDQLEAEMAALQADETEQENALRLRGEARRDSLTAVADMGGELTGTFRPHKTTRVYSHGGTKLDAGSVWMLLTISQIHEIFDFDRISKSQVDEEASYVLFQVCSAFQDPSVTLVKLYELGNDIE